VARPICRSRSQWPSSSKPSAAFSGSARPFRPLAAASNSLIDEVYNTRRLRARLPEPRAIRGSPRPAEGQNRRVILSSSRGALHGKVKMSRTIRELPELRSPTGRRRLKAGRQPPWHAPTRGAHLGWQRWPEDRAGRWLLRTRRDGNYTTAQIAIADDALPADGVSVLDFEMARAKAVEQQGERPVGRITVACCCANYLDDLAHRGKNARDAKYAFDAHVLPEMGKMAVEHLTAGRLKRFFRELAKTPARRRTGRGREQKYKQAPGDDETIRQRRSTANRVYALLRAALNLAFADGEVSSDNAWLRVKPLKGTQKARS